MKARKVAATHAFMKAALGHGEAIAKAGAPWDDRTSHARGGLNGDAEIVASSPVMTRFVGTLAHTEDYGRWLETVLGAAMGERAGMSIEELQDPALIGPYAIIHPTIDQIIPEIRTGVFRIWQR